MKTYLKYGLETIGVLVGWALLSLIHEQLQKLGPSSESGAASSYYVGLLAFVAFAVIIVSIWGLRKDVNRLPDSLDSALGPLAADINMLKDGTTLMRYYAANETNTDGQLFTLCKNIIENATHSIFALNSWREEQSIGEQPEFRAAYFRALMDAYQGRDDFEYQRLVQLNPVEHDYQVPLLIKKTFDESYIKHFREMLQAKSKRPGPHKINVTIVPPRFPSTFVIIDGKHLLWQLNEVDETKPIGVDSKKRFKMRGVVYVYDPHGDFIKNFQDTYRFADNGGYDMELKHLPEIVAV
jgi:hypothetical protein